MPDNLRIGIVGLGFGASVHLPVFHSLPGVEVIAVAGSGSYQKIEIYEKGGIKNLLRPWEAIVQDNDIDAISVVVPPFAQSDIVCRALSSGKHVLCEKPFGRDVKEAAAMLHVAKDMRVVNAVDFEFRMEPGIHALKREIEKGVIGKITHIDVVWLTEGGTDNLKSWSWRHNAEQGGGVLGAFGSHVIDYLQWMLDAKIVKVFARSRITVPFRKDSQGNNREVTAEDSLEIFCEFSNDISAWIQISNCCRFSPKHHIEISGSLGRLHYTHKKPFTLEMISLQLETSQGLHPIELEKPSLIEGTDTRLLPFKRLANLFIKEIHGEVDRDLPRFKDGYDVQTVMLAVRKSILSGGMVTVEREEP
jgi:predicted dehydrogenase